MPASDLPEFRNEPFLDFSIEPNRRAQTDAIARVEAGLGREHALVIGGERVSTRETFRSLDPSDPSRVVGIFAKAGEAEARRAVDAAERAFESWRFTKSRERAAVLVRAAAVMRRRRFELNALQMIEIGKTWPEADAETAEAIDFLEFYAREALRLGGPQPLTPLSGEANELRYIPLGVGAVIPPWNFALAILAGMTSAALVAGNTVVVKPSSDAPLIAATVVEILEQAGAPAGTVNLLTGPGASAGETLAAHPRTRFIAFTGSRDVGVKLAEIAGRVAPGQIWLKRAVLEMGGKDFTIVDADADLDAAAAGVIAGAFGYQGQKCSACSRAIVDARVYDHFVARLVPLVEALTVGPATDPASHLGPVINSAARDKIESAIEIGRREGRLLCGGGRADGPGYFLRPTIFVDVPENARIAREEIFGPVLSVIRARDFDDAVRIANGTEYGLTGSFYTRSRETIALGRRLLHCGNLYVNRKCTGAMVGAHPFGGFNMSGTDSKAGGRDYLLLCTQAKVISEKLG
ncbi:MAG: L-glutamate gamma-semialdehyde dehydrogenase [Myxococcota bacterium]